MKHNKESVAFAVQQMKQDPILADFTDETLRSSILKMEIFQTGLCVMAANHLLPMAFKEERRIEMLDRAVEEIIRAEQARGRETQCYTRNVSRSSTYEPSVRVRVYTT